MNALETSLVAFAFILGGALLGVFLRRALPEHHLSPDAKDVVRLGTGLVGTISALVLGLMISSASSAFNAQDTQVKQVIAKIILLDNLLAQYGPEGRPARELIRRAVTDLADRIWGNNAPSQSGGASFSATETSKDAETTLLELSPSSEAQRVLKTQAVQLMTDIGQARLLLFAQQRDSTLPIPFLVVLVFWLTIIFMSFSLFSEPNVVVGISLVIFALSAAGAIFLILELNQPFTGMMEISDLPLRHALAPLS